MSGTDLVKRHPFAMTQENATQSDCFVLTHAILPRNREADAYEIGYQIAQLRWHLRAAILSGSNADEEMAKTCIAKIQPLLTSLFPEQRGGEAYTVADSFRRNWEVLHSEWFGEEFHAALNDRGELLEVADVVERLEPFVPTIDEEILKPLVAAWRENDSRLQRALQLGRCVGEGRCPIVGDEVFFEFIDNPDYAQWLSTGSGSGFSFTPRVPGTKQPRSQLIRPKQINPGDFEPDRTWSDEVRQLMAAVGLSGPLPIALDMPRATPEGRCTIVKELNAWIRIHLQGMSPQGTGPEIPQQPSQPEQLKPTHERSSESIPRSPLTCNRQQVDEMTDAPSEVAVEDAVDRNALAKDEGSLAVSNSLAVKTPGIAATSQQPSQIENASGSADLASDERHPRKEWTVTNRSVSFRGLTVVFSDSNARLLKAITDVGRWNTNDEVCEIIDRTSKAPKEERRHRLRARIAKLNAAILKKFHGLPPNWNAVKHSRCSVGGVSLVIVEMPSGYRPPQDTDSASGS